jgi:tetratricopeptide (TPR) repeat protein
LAKGKGIRKQLSEMTASGRALDKQINSLVAQGKYSQAIRKLQQGLKRDPDQTLSIAEWEIWLAQGQDEFNSGRYRQAETSLSSAVALEPNVDTYYWLAKCFLAQKKEAEALELLQSAFDDKSLPKDLGGCYLKLLMLNDQADTVEALVQKQSKRFYAPHLHWARGVLALKTDEPEVALTHFQKMGRPTSKGDHVNSWQAYAHQQAGNWSEAETLLGMANPGFTFSSFRPVFPHHPAVNRLRMAQVAHTDKDLLDFVDVNRPDLPNRDAALVLDLLHLISENNFHDAAHVAVKLPPKVKAEYPELEQLYRPLMLLAGDQAQKQGEIGCTAEFWGAVVNQPEFDPQLAVQLYPAMDQAGEHRQARQLVDQLMRWVKKQAKQNPQAWPESRLNPTLAKLHCWMADNQMISGLQQEGKRNLRKAEKLAPDHPDVIGRKGLEAAMYDKTEESIRLLTKALEAGCRYPETYLVLTRNLEDRPDQLKTIRRKFGKHFGDIGVETEVDMPTWIEALSFQNYELMEQVVKDQKKPTAPVKALQIFLDAADDDPSSSGKITLNQEKAVPQWDKLLESISPKEKVDTLQTIYLAIQNHARRNKKGIAALQSRYSQEIFALIPEVPEANLAHLVLLPLKKLSEERLSFAINASLGRATQPGNLLAKAQLHLRRFSDEPGFRYYIDQQLKQEPQNPLLLLARATFHPHKSPQYQTYYDQGFELARRLQDAEALQAYREEDWYQAQQLTGHIVGDQIANLGDPSQLDMVDVLQRMAREAFGMDVPPEVIAQMLPELEAQMGYDDDDYDDEFDPFFPPPPPGRGKKSSKKRKKSFFDL